MKQIMSELVEKARQWLSNRALAYQRVFNQESADTQLVLMDLANFCRANASTFHEDARAHAVMEGRREVWLRIQHHLRLSDEQLWKLYNKS